MYAPAVVGEVVEFDGISGSALFVISTEARDREGDVVISKGCLESLPSYQQNPVVLWDHGQQDMLPIGLSEDPKTKTLTIEVMDNKILGRAFFHSETLLASQVARLVEKNVLRAASIGYEAISGKPVDPRNPKRGSIYDAWELVEWSVVPVGCNPEAIRMSLSAKWDGKRLVSPIARTFKSLLKPSTTLILPASSRATKVKAVPDDKPKPTKRTKAMPDEVVPAQDEAVKLPAGAQGIQTLMDGAAAMLAALGDIYPTIEQPQVIKALDKFIEQLKSQVATVVKLGASTYPDLENFKAAAEESETDPEPATDDAGEETTEETAEEEEKSDDISDVGEDDEKEKEGLNDDDEEDDKKDKSLKLRKTKSWQKDCEPHVATLKDAVELLDDMSKSANIPSGYKRQCKGVLPGITNACSWMSGKAAELDEGDAPEKTKADETTEDDEEMTSEEKAAVLKSLKLVGSKIDSNQAEITKLRKGKV